jgi:ketosteroid isomerase-like protein
VKLARVQRVSRERAARFSVGFRGTLSALERGDDGNSAMRITLPRLGPTRTAGIIVLVAVAALGIYLLVRERVTSEEARIRALISDIKQAFEQEKLKKCMAVVADDYSDDFVSHSKADLEDTLRFLFQIAHRIDVDLDDITIRVRGDEADIVFTATANAETTFGDVSLNREVGHTRFILALRKEHGRWKVFRAEALD